jgi:hypothetical protein
MSFTNTDRVGYKVAFHDLWQPHLKGTRPVRRLVEKKILLTIFNLTYPILMEINQEIRSDFRGKKPARNLIK